MEEFQLPQPGQQKHTSPIKSLDFKDTTEKIVAAGLHLSEGEFEEALSQLRSIDATADSNQQRATRLILMGRAYEGLNDTRNALGSYRQDRSLDPDNPTPLLREGVHYYRLGNIEKAIQLLERYLSYEQGNCEAYYYLFIAIADGPDKEKYLRKLAELDGPTGGWLKKAVEMRRRHLAAQQAYAQEQANKRRED